MRATDPTLFQCQREAIPGRAPLLLRRESDLVTVTEPATVINKVDKRGCELVPIHFINGFGKFCWCSVTDDRKLLCIALNNIARSLLSTGATDPSSWMP